MRRFTALLVLSAVGCTPAREPTTAVMPAAAVTPAAEDKLGAELAKVRRAERKDVTLSELDEVLKGKTHAEVEALVGKPKGVLDGNWYYSNETHVLWDRRFGVWMTFIVHFKDSKVVGVN